MDLIIAGTASLLFGVEFEGPVPTRVRGVSFHSLGWPLLIYAACIFIFMHFVSDYKVLFDDWFWRQRPHGRVFLLLLIYEQHAHFCDHLPWGDILNPTIQYHIFSPLNVFVYDGVGDEGYDHQWSAFGFVRIIASFSLWWEIWHCTCEKLFLKRHEGTYDYVICVLGMMLGMDMLFLNFFSIGDIVYSVTKEVAHRYYHLIKSEDFAAWPYQHQILEFPICGTSVGLLTHFPNFAIGLGTGKSMSQLSVPCVRLFMYPLRYGFYNVWSRPELWIAMTNEWLLMFVILDAIKSFFSQWIQ